MAYLASWPCTAVYAAAGPSSIAGTSSNPGFLSITALPLKFRAVVSLRYASHLTFAEIGKILHMPETTAKTYFQRSKPLLRQALREELSQRLC